ncbi:MAG: endolytic transglycosylase MltG [Candidatus Eremiobacteraeota bacterium]|nr:endolytic transglycosylase MltG [Candidatus Eremiobacteraeota bacterium]
MRRALLAAAVLVLLIVASLGWLWFLVYADRSHPTAGGRVIIDRGLTFTQAEQQLAAAGIIGNVTTFRILAHVRGEEADVRAGEYEFAPHLTQSEVLHALVTGGAQVAAWVTIPEGFTAAQIAERLQNSGIGSAKAFLREFLDHRLVVDGTPTRNLEGFLFPSTYLLPLGASPQQASAPMIAEFFKELPAGAASAARALHLTVPQAVIVASLVEREAKSEIDRPRIAEVIYNRLALGMPLQVDAAIEYALPAHKSLLTYGDLKVDSPYNTYEHAGLPPTPIANPGRLSLEAAFDPSKGDDLYYVYCGNGRHVFAKTLAEHQANVARCLQ